MRRADRLFQTVQVLRRRRCVTAAQLAERLEVSERTVYRYIRDLEASGVPIVGEAGVGYRLDPTYELPPLSFNREEVEALVLGMRMVEQWGDADLRRSARSVVDKLELVLPEAHRQRLNQTKLFALSFQVREPALRQLQRMRDAAARQRKVSIRYADERGARTKRVIRPLGCYFWGQTWTVGAYCELRNGFRNFRLDRIERAQTLREGFALEPPVTIADYVRAMSAT